MQDYSAEHQIIWSSIDDAVLGSALFSWILAGTGLPLTFACLLGCQRRWGFARTDGWERTCLDQSRQHLWPPQKLPKCHIRQNLCTFVLTPEVLALLVFKLTFQILAPQWISGKMLFCHLQAKCFGGGKMFWTPLSENGAAQSLRIEWELQKVASRYYGGEFQWEVLLCQPRRIWPNIFCSKYKI